MEITIYGVFIGNPNREYSISSLSGRCRAITTLQERKFVPKGHRLTAMDHVLMEATADFTAVETESVGWLSLKEKHVRVTGKGEITLDNKDRQSLERVVDSLQP